MLPLNWQRVRLGDIILSLKTGLNPRKFFKLNTPNANNYYVTVRELEEYTIKFTHQTDRIDDNALSLCLKRSNLEKDDVLFSGTGTIGKVSIIKENPNNWAIKEGIYSIKPNKKIVFPRFLMFCFENLNIQNDIKSKSSEGIVKSISMNDLQQITIPLPPLNEQIAIANILSALDRYLYALDALILKKEGVKKALSFELLSQRKRLKGFNQAWQRVRLGDIGKPCMCKRVMKHQTTRYGEIPFYKIGTFGNTADAFISKKLFLEYKTKYSFPKKGDILISASGTIGRAVIYDGKPAYFQDSNIVWIDNDETLVKNDFLFYAYSNVKWNTEHTTILRLYNDNFRNTLIPLPPLNEQIAIANILSGLDDEIASLKNKKRQFENIKKALNHDLMSAKIRVLKK
ncbi:restriction endonuclease subunit S [Helicobacter pylori]|uniref:restriction endonuclease subunit S n=1 Tax=Helicobacter pylori TaxID=210 RepID=UPI001EEEDF90|nr:restriction endonuclease subunit S [Helicobacter pylori]